MPQNVTIPQLDAAAIEALRGRSLLTTQDFNDGELQTLLHVAEAFATLDKAGRKPLWLHGELAYSLFFDQSTRTRSAWAGAAARLGMHPVIVDGKSTQVEHGETAIETGAMLGMNSHALGVRHDLVLDAGRAFIADIKTGIDGYLDATADPRAVPIVNLQCDFDHPTQTLADALWLREHVGDIAGKKIAVSWAYSPSYAKPLSVPQGLIMLLTRFGANVTLAHPEGYDLVDEAMAHAKANAARSGGSFKVTRSMDEAFEGAHVVYPKSWGPLDLMRERIGVRDDATMASIEKRMLARNADFKDWICDERRMATTANGDALYMHCLPADIGDEVSAGVMNKHKVHVAREASKKVFAIMALLAIAKVPSLAGRLQQLAGGVA